MASSFSLSCGASKKKKTLGPRIHIINNSNHEWLSKFTEFQLYLKYFQAQAKKDLINNKKKKK